MSKLYFRYGAMSSGKTAALLQVAYNYERQNMKVIVGNIKKDSKSKGE